MSSTSLTVQLAPLAQVEQVELKKELSIIETEAQVFLRELETIEVQTQEDLTDSEELVKAVKKKWRDIETKRTTVTVPLNEALKATNNLFKPTLKYLEQCEKVLKNKIAVGRRYLLSRQTEALKALGEASMRGDMEAARAAMLSTPSAQLTGSTSIRTSWEAELEDIQQVPEEYLMLVVNWDLVRARIKEGVRQIAGFKIFEKDTVISRK